MSHQIQLSDLLGYESSSTTLASSTEKEGKSLSIHSKICENKVESVLKVIKKKDVLCYLGSRIEDAIEVYNSI